MTYIDFCNTNNKNIINNKEAQEVFKFLAKPINVLNMTAFSDVGLPAITGLVSKIEDDYENSTTFSILNHKNRQLVGKMIKYILSFYGYEPIIGGLDERARLRNFSKAGYFKTGAIYTLTNKPYYKIVVNTFKPLKNEQYYNIMINTVKC